MIRSKNGYYGEFGGRYVPEALLPPLMELEYIFNNLRDDASFWDEYLNLTQEFSGRPTPLTPLRRLSQELGGAQIWLKREDLNHSGAYSLNSVLGQGLLMQRMGKTRVIADTSASQHGVAVAIMAAKMGFNAKIYIGAKDVDRYYLNVLWMRQLGAEVQSIETGAQNLKEAVGESLRDWGTNFSTTHYAVSTACGPAPFPELVTYFQSVISMEIKHQALKQFGRLPDEVIACVGGGSNALGTFSEFLPDLSVNLVAVEAGGKGVQPGENAIRLQPNTAEPGIAHGYKTLFLQDKNGQLRGSYSVATGLEYVGLSPILAYLSKTHRLTPEIATDEEAKKAFSLLLKTEGIIPSLESSHALASGFKRAQQLSSNRNLIINLSGRGEKDIFNVVQPSTQASWKQFLSRESRRIHNQPETN